MTDSINLKTREDMLKEIIELDKQIEELPRKETQKLKKLILSREQLKNYFNSLQINEDDRIR